MQKFAEAISDLSHFLSKRNKNYLIYQNDAYALRALAYLKLGDLKKSQNDADKSDDGPLILEISKAQNLLRLTKSKNITPEQSYDYYTSLIEICPCCSAFFRETAELAKSNEELSLKYLNFLNKLIEESPGNDELLIQREIFLKN